MSAVTNASVDLEPLRAVTHDVPWYLRASLHDLPTDGCTKWRIQNGALPSDAIDFVGLWLAGGQLVPDTLESRIRSAARSSQLDSEVKDGLHAAVCDATSYVAVHLAGRNPRVSITEEGSVLLHWEHDGDGVAIVFAGDKTVAYSEKTATAGYATSLMEVSLTTPLAPELIAKMSILERR